MGKQGEERGSKCKVKGKGSEEEVKGELRWSKGKWNSWIFFWFIITLTHDNVNK